MSNARLDDFKRVILKDQPIPDDLLKLWKLQASRAPDAPASADPLAHLRVRLIEPGRIPALLDHSYLNDDDRADADIMRNSAAFDEVFELSTFVVELDEGEVLGYWHGPEQTPISAAPILMLDTEGQFEIVPGLTLTDGLLGRALEYHDEPEVADMLKWLSRHQIFISAERLEDLVEPHVAVLPSEIHFGAYNRRRIADGLPPV